MQVERDAIESTSDEMVGTPAAPEADALREPVDEDGDGDDGTDVERDLGPAGDVPERVAERNGRGHEDSNLSTARIVSAAEYGSSVPSRTRSTVRPTAPPASARSTFSLNSSSSRPLSSSRDRKSVV